MGTPVVYLLSGLPAAGKTTYAKMLERNGVHRLSVDEMIMERYGRIGKDYPADQHLSLLDGILQDVERELIGLIKSANRSSWTTGWANGPSVITTRLWSPKQVQRGNCSTSGPTTPNCSGGISNATSTTTVA